MRRRTRTTRTKNLTLVVNTAHALASTSDGTVLVFLSRFSFSDLVTATYSFARNTAAATVRIAKYTMFCGITGAREVRSHSPA